MSARRKLLFKVVSIVVAPIVCGALVVALHFAGVVDLGPNIDELLRGRSERAARARKVRILAVGDSFLRRWPHLSFDLHDGLRSYFDGHGMGAVVAADSGSGPDVYAKIIRNKLHELDPRLVVLFYYVGNDTTDVLQEMEGKAPASLPARRCRCDPAAAERWRFDWKMMIDCGVDRGLVELARQARGQPEHVGTKLVSPFLICMGLTRPGVYRENLLLEGAAARRAWPRARQHLEHIFRLTKKSGAELLIVAIPAAVQVHPGHHDLMKRMNVAVDRRFLETSVPQERLRGLCDRHGVKYVDLLPRFRKDPGAADLFFPVDDHFSARGHRLAMKVLEEEALAGWVAAQKAR